MIKQQLADCCGAYHVYGFHNPRDRDNYVTTNRGRRPVTELQQLQIWSTHGSTTFPEWQDGEYTSNSLPGLLTCVLTGYQNMNWESHLRKFGWVLTSDNAQNANSGNSLFFWIKVCRGERGVRPNSYQPPVRQTAGGPWTLNGRPYTGPIRWKDNGTPYRVRCPISGELHTPVCTSLSPQVLPEIPVTPLPLMRG